MPITALPTPPSRADSANFASRADAFLAALPTFATEANALAVDVNDDAVAAAASAASAVAASAAAVAASGVVAWVSGTTYSVGFAVYSPANLLTYRRKIAGAGTTDPSLDTTNWTLVVGTGDVTQTGNQTLQNKIVVEKVFTITDAAAFEINPENGGIQLITLGANRTPKATTFAAGGSVVLMVDDGSAFSLTWSDTTFGPSGVVWETDNGSPPTLATTGYTVIVLWKVASQVYGARVGNA